MIFTICSRWQASFYVSLVIIHVSQHAYLTLFHAVTETLCHLKNEGDRIESSPLSGDFTTAIAVTNK